MKYLILLVPLVLFSLFSTASGTTLLPDTFFTATIVDESGMAVDAPFLLQVRQILDGQEIQTFRLDLYANPDLVNVPWTVPDVPENMEFHIIAIKQGYDNSDEYVFTVTSQTPTEGELFNHKFILNTQELSRVSTEKYPVFSNNQEFTIDIKTSSVIESIEFFEEDVALRILLTEDAFRGTSSFTIPSSLIHPPFGILLDENIVFPSTKETSRSTTLDFDYQNGVHSILIIGSIDPALQPTDSVDFDDDQPDTGGGGCLIATH